MENRLIALDLVLRELGIPLDISTLDDRKRVQKAVYLGQRSGIDLGYRFGWYLLGPYSTDLTRDYFALSAALDDGEALPARVLRDETRKSLARVRPLMNVPEEVNLEQEDWLELLASLHYLQTISGLTFNTSVAAMKGTSKEPLLTYAPVAEKLLAQAGLI